MRNRLLALAFAASCAIAAGAAVAGASVAPRLVRSGTLLRIERGSVAYGFDCATRTEFLWRRDAAGAWSRVEGPDEATVAPMRSMLLHRLHRAGLADIPVDGAAELRGLKALGYL